MPIYTFDTFYDPVNIVCHCVLIFSNLTVFVSLNNPANTHNFVLYYQSVAPPPPQPQVSTSLITVENVRNTHRFFSLNSKWPTKFTIDTCNMVKSAVNIHCSK